MAVVAAIVFMAVVPAIVFMAMVALAQPQVLPNELRVSLAPPTENGADCEQQVSKVRTASGA